MEALILPLLAHLDGQYVGIVIWALSATALNLKLLAALCEAHARFNAFVSELAAFNRRFEPAEISKEPP